MPPQMVCPQCRTAVAPGDQRCRGCGVPFVAPGGQSQVAVGPQFSGPPPPPTLISVPLVGPAYALPAPPAPFPAPLAPSPSPHGLGRLQIEPERRGSSRLLGVALLLVLAGGVGSLLLWRTSIAARPSSPVQKSVSKSSALTLPMQIAGLAPYHTASLDDQTIAMRQSVAGQVGIAGTQVSFYGTPAGKFLMFIGVQGEISQLSQAQFLDQAAASLASAGVTVNQALPALQTINGIQITCYPIRGSAGTIPVGGALCLSIKGNVLECVATYSGFDTKASATAAADARARST